jgi:uncharacterized ferritin-like protein (DUF455 family)
LAATPPPEQTKVVRGVTLRRDPARESCFNVVHIHTDLADYVGMSDVARRQRLHKHMHNEMQSLEIAAQTLADFPDAEWAFRMDLARQCWDETRHTRVLYRRLLEIGGRKGEFSVMNFEWGITCMLDSLGARLGLQNRTFEGGEMDLLRRLAQVWRESGDPETAEILEGILADEIQHVSFANRWFRQMSSKDRKVLLQLAEGVNFLKKVTRALAPAEGETNAAGVVLSAFEHTDVIANVDDRRRAGFSEQEIARLIEQEAALNGAAPVAPSPAPA